MGRGRRGRLRRVRRVVRRLEYPPFWGRFRKESAALKRMAKFAIESVGRDGSWAMKKTQACLA